MPILFIFCSGNLISQNDFQNFKIEFRKIYTSSFLAIKGGDTLTSDFKIIPKENAKEIEYSLAEIRDTFYESFIISNNFIFKKIDTEAIKSLQIWDTQKNECSRYTKFKQSMGKGMEVGKEKISIGTNTFINTNLSYKELIEEIEIDTLGHNCSFLKISPQNSLSPNVGDNITYETYLSNKSTFPLNIFVPDLDHIKNCPVLIDILIKPTNGDKKLKLHRNLEYFELAEKSIKINLESIEAFKGPKYLSVHDLIDKEK